jgi:hypothetical protein
VIHRDGRIGHYTSHTKGQPHCQQEAGRIRHAVGALSLAHAQTPATGNKIKHIPLVTRLRVTLLTSEFSSLLPWEEELYSRFLFDARVALFLELCHCLQHVDIGGADRGVCVCVCVCTYTYTYMECVCMHVYDLHASTARIPIHSSCESMRMHD